MRWKIFHNKNEIPIQKFHVNFNNIKKSLNEYLQWLYIVKVNSRCGFPTREKSTLPACLLVMLGKMDTFPQRLRKTIVLLSKCKVLMQEQKLL